MGANLHMVFSTVTRGGGLGVAIEPVRRLIESPTKIFVGGLPIHVTEGALKRELECFGPVEICNVPGGVARRGYGFVKFWSPRSAQMAIRAAAREGIFMDGARLRVELGHWK
jgi:RNA recognition motif-containing protein